MGKRFGMAVTGLTAGAVLGAGCTGPAPEGGPSFAPTTGAQEATPSPGPETTHIVVSPSASPEAITTPTPSPERAGEIGSLVIGIVANTREHGEVWAYTSPDAAVRNGTFPEGAEVPIVCFDFGAKLTDTYEEPPQKVTWNKWLKVEVPEHLKEEVGEKWLPYPYVNLKGEVDHCDEVLSTPSAD